MLEGPPGVGTAFSPGLTVWVSRRSAEVALALALPSGTERAARRFLAVQAPVLPGTAGPDAAIFLVEGARANLATAALEVGLVRIRHLPIQAVRFAWASVRLWLVLKAVEAAGAPAGERPGRRA